MNFSNMGSRLKGPILPFAGFAVLMLVTFVLAYRNILRYTLVGYGDTGPFLAPNNALSFFMSAWQPYSLGHFENLQSWWVLQYIMGTLFGNLGQYILMISLAPLSGIFQYILLGQFRVGPLSRYSASFIYALNVFVVGEYQGGGFSVFLIYTLIPIVAFFTLRLLRDMSVTNFFLFCIATGLTYFAHPHAIILIAPVVLVLWIVEVWRRRNGRFIVSSLVAGGLWIAISLLLYLPYYGNLNIFSELFSAAFSPTNASGVTLNLSLKDFAWTYRNAWGLYPSFLSVSNLIGFHYILIPLAFVSILLTEGRRREYAIGFSFLIAGIILFIYYTALQLTYSLFLRFTVLNIFENPVKLVAILMFASSLLVSFSLDEIIRRLPGVLSWKPLALTWKRLPLASKPLPFAWKRLPLASKPLPFAWKPLPPRLKKHLVPSIIALMLIAIFLIPLYGTLAAGDMGLISGYPGDSFVTPSSFYTLKNWLDARHGQEGFFRTLWLPLGPETLSPSLSIDPWSFALGGSSIRYRHQSVGFAYTVLSHLTANDTDNVAGLLGMAGVKYVIVDVAHSQQTGDPRVILWSDAYLAVGDPMKFVNLLSTQAGLSRIYANDNMIDDNFALFENRLYTPHVSLYQNSPIGNYTDLIHWTNTTKNLVANPSFENGLVNWNIFTSTEITWDYRYVHSPNYSARINNTRSPGGGWSVLWQTLPVVGGATYNISLWLRTENVNATHVKLVYYSNYNAGSEEQAILEQKISGDIIGSTEWSKISYVGQAPSTAVRMDFDVAGGWPLPGSPSGLTWVDDVGIYRGNYHANIPPASPIQPTTHKLSETQYQIDLPPHGPLFLVLYESYDSNWVATSPGTVDPSFMAFGWANGFTIPPSSSEIGATLNFQLEPTRTVAIQAWTLAWTLLVGGTIASSAYPNWRNRPRILRGRNGRLGLNRSAHEPLHFARWVHAGSSLMEFEVPIDRNSMNAFMEIWFLGAYDSLKPSRGSVVIDAGANVGLFTLRASEWVGESGRVIAIEPEPHYCEILSRNLARNNIRNVTVVQKAVSDTSGRIELCGRTVDTVTLDELREKLGTDFPEAIKIDIEGFEVKALRGGEKTIAQASKLAFETHSKSLELEVRSFLTQAGFQVHRTSSDRLITKLALSIALNPIAFALSELDRVLSWRTSGGPLLFEPVRWLLQHRRPDWMSPGSDLKLITAQKPAIQKYDTLGKTRE